MKWLSILKVIAALTPEMIQLISVIAGAISAAPAQHQTAIGEALDAALAAPSKPTIA